ncbi:MAG: aminotransferase DegT, partial [Micrococcales bacterium]
ATGYRRETVPVFDVDGRPIRLQGEHDHRPHVDERSRVRTAQGEMVDGLFATGLDTGYPMAGRFGEPSFTGTANGTALWQTTIGTEIVDQCLARSRAQRGSA